MNDITKKIISIILMFSVFLAIFTGCENDKEYGDDVIKLRWVTFGSAVPDDVKEVMEAANKYSADKIGIVTEIEYQPKEKINLLIASGEYYDIVFTSSWLNPYNTNAAKGMYYDITDIVKSETPNLYKIIGKYWEAAELNGRYYGVPTLKDMGSEMLYRINSDYFEGEKGMTIPESMKFEDIEPFLEAYKKDNPTKYPLAMDKGGVPGYAYFLENVVSSLITIPYSKDKPKAIAVWDNEEMLKRWRLLHKWQTLGYINPDAASIDPNAVPKDTPVRYGVAWKGYSGYSNPADWGFNVKLSRYDGPYISKTSEQGAMLAICAGCDEKHAKAALKYIELLNTDRYFRDILAYGIEGKHFEYLENGTVMRTKDGIDRYQQSLYTTGSVVNASVSSISKDLLSDPQQWEAVYAGYEQYGIWSNTDGFVYDLTRKEDIIATVTAIYSNYLTDLITGTSDPDVVIPKMKAEMEAAGINELIDDIQNQLDEHLENNSYNY